MDKLLETLKELPEFRADIWIFGPEDIGVQAHQALVSTVHIPRKCESNSKMKKLEHLLLEALTYEICKSRNPSEATIKVLYKEFSEYWEDASIEEIFDKYDQLTDGWLFETIFPEW